MISKNKDNGIKERYINAINSFRARLEDDPRILSLILSGSLSYDDVWEKSDIDVIIVHDDESSPTRDLNLIEDGILIEAHAISRRYFKRSVDAGLQGRLFHSFVSTSKILFSKDETINGLFNDIMDLGKRDREVQLLRHYTEARRAIDYAQKMLYFRSPPDIFYAFYELIYAASSLARVEAIIAGEIPRREVLRQALKLNPNFFNAIYTGLLEGEKDYQTLDILLNEAELYLDERLEIVYKPVLDYLTSINRESTESELNERFNRDGAIHTPFFQSLNTIHYHFLADKGILTRVTSPVKLTKKGLRAQEPAYFYDGSHEPVTSYSNDSLTPEKKKEVMEYYNSALASFTGKLRRDPSVIAVLLCGSLASEDAWFKSDINVIIVHDDEKTPARRNIKLLEQEIRFLTSTYYQDDFKKLLEGNMSGNNTHTMLFNSKFLFTKDPLLEELFEDIKGVGKECKWQMMYNYSQAGYNMEKAGKMLKVKDDVHYSYIYVLWMVYFLCRIEALKNREVIELEILNQAKRLNPDFFGRLYTDLLSISTDKDEMGEKLGRIIEEADQYMEERIREIYKPILKYLAAQGVAVSESELDEHFTNMHVPVNHHYLVEKGIVELTTAPLKITEKIRTHVEEPAYYYDAE